MNELLNAWPLVLFLAIGIGVGRFIERRRAKRNAAAIAATVAVIPKAGQDVRRALRSIVTTPQEDEAAIDARMTIDRAKGKR